MLVHLLRRLGQSVLVLLAVSFISFMVFRHIGDPTISLLGEDATVAEREAQSRRFAAKFQFVVMIVVIGAVAVFAAQAVSGVLSRPFSAVGAALGGGGGGAIAGR